MIKVSAIVPVYNPGADIDNCIRTLLDQSLAEDEYEVIFVDDGSTDGTGERLDRLAAAHPNVRVRRIRNSGWPGRPRNVGIDMAQGEFVFFVDNDDWVGGEALERLLNRAIADDADVVVGKVVGHQRTIPNGIFRCNRRNVTLEWPPLVRLLTPHKLFRKALLDTYGIRYPEGQRRLEDHLFVMHAYFHADRISILADYTCYHWVHRGDAFNASAERFDPAAYYASVRRVLDLIDEHHRAGRAPRRPVLPLVPRKAARASRRQGAHVAAPRVHAPALRGDPPARARALSHPARRPAAVPPARAGVAAARRGLG